MSNDLERVREFVADWVDSTDGDHAREVLADLDTHLKEDAEKEDWHLAYTVARGDADAYKAENARLREDLVMCEQGYPNVGDIQALQAELTELRDWQRRELELNERRDAELTELREAVREWNRTADGDDQDAHDCSVDRLRQLIEEGK